MSLTYPEYIRRKWGKFPVLYKILGDLKVPDSRLTSADDSSQDIRRRILDVIELFDYHSELVEKSIISFDPGEVFSDLQNLEEAVQGLKGDYQHSVMWLEREVLPKIEELKKKAKKRI
jgi:hypothetical protein